MLCICMLHIMIQFSGISHKCCVFCWTTSKISVFTLSSGHKISIGRLLDVLDVDWTSYRLPRRLRDVFWMSCAHWVNVGKNTLSYNPVETIIYPVNRTFTKRLFTMYILKEHFLSFNKQWLKSAYNTIACFD